MQALHLLQRLKACHAGHVLIQKDDVGLGSGQYIQGIVTVAGGDHIVVLTFQVNDIRLQQIYFVINPKYSVHSVSIY